MTTDEERFTALYERHYTDVERYVVRRASDVAARDVVADVFVVIWRRIGDVPEPALPWIYGVARRVLANELRGVQRRRQLEQKVAGHAGDDTAADHADDVTSAAVLAAAFERLPETDRETLRLIAWEELSTRDAATAAGCSLATFAMRLHRARRRLRREMTPHTAPTALLAQPGLN
ncbi:DNA-directed RNA polymerase sigma-70 factor [Actinoplanes sp. OR16]|uniref:RNA polymerase sigma factor n=1 Tax=Actinoplanes sp. OR16 TaxID=946334 RepID=UPI000F711F41|nr:RNA polymerase sigma factor [Actinoplanes sp. OR16]BBH64061.1 DNA-directed RNA polymerase sigma-70 factor [Actinoplanes sp. OR16]